MRLFASFLFLCLLAPSVSFAQAFLSPIAELSGKQPSYIVLLDGTRVEGTIPVASFMNSTLRSFQLKDSSGENTRYKAVDVAELGNKPSALAKMAAMSDQMDGPLDMITADWKGVMEREWVIFRRALLPGKADKFALMQLLNPGFDSRIEVFYDAKAANNDDSVMGISTAPAESYIVVVDGKRSVQVKKNGYKKDFPDLFGSCQEMMGKAPAKPKFKNFAAHVFAFEQLCRKK